MSLKDVVDEAVRDLAEHGFDGTERLAYWEERIKRAAETEMGPSAQTEDLLRDVLRRTFEKLISNGGVERMHPGVARWTIEKVHPELRAELDRRILASANLIRLNKRRRVEETLARFSGWATSVPKGGSDNVDIREEKKRIAAPVAQVKFEERRVLIDQGHKLTAAVNDVVAVGGGAIAAVWRSRWRQPGYDYRPDHKERDEVVYSIRGSWALEKGLIRKSPNGHTDEITRPAEEISCRCSYLYVYTLRNLERLMPEMITKVGREVMENARRAAAA